ncbi:hypothetical protein TRFO_34286 [Tritrichomonas foetus]|uniref:Uncharacterized protein n=1 Tax=Tritrichomonas foetus TaxID=1144522 RepID=A0A1J4JJI1_9EUKA|nr:hypothetical protein TRFO_34286 [Tritrichomonas foetus]|eukprot:OHS99312.1 hypothetical protein TRFO_34286 [Tritrichomonas foetus]
MLRVTTHDYNFFQLVSYLKQPTADTTRLVKSIQAFRSKLSLKWLEQFTDEDPEECLTAVWLILFKLSTHDDATVRISIYSAIGGLLFSLLPFSPLVIMKSFANATQQHKVTSKASIAIISSFLYICHSISPSDLDNFMTMALVTHHFSVDVSNFIQHIPKFIPLMAPLDVQFHQSLLRSLLSSFGRNPNHDFVKSVVSLVALNPEVLIKDLMEFTISNSLNQTILALGPQILKHDKIYPLLNDDYISSFESAAFSIVSNAENTMSDFEQACGTLSILVNRFDGEKLEKLKVKITENTQKEYPKHFQRLLLQLPTALENLHIQETDSNSIKCAKINALINYTQKTNEKLPVLLLLKSLGKIEGDVLTTMINALNVMFPLLLGVNDEILSEIIRSLLSIRGQTWLQNSALLNLLIVIGSDLGNKLISNFEELVIPLILEFSCSPQDELSNVAIETLSEFVSLKNIETIKSFLWSVNYFEPQTALHFVILLNTIADVLGPECVYDFAAIAAELVVFHPSEAEIAGNAFKFINKCKFYQNVPNDVISACIDWITRLYVCITQNNSKITSPLKNEALPPLISTVETDVVASNILDNQSKMLPLLHCFEFFVALKGILSPYCIVFTCELVKLFPDTIIPLAMSIPKPNIKEFADLTVSVASILKAESSLRTASICCDFLSHFASNETQNKLKENVNFFVDNPKVCDGIYLCHFYKYLVNLSHITQQGNQNKEEIEEKLLNSIKSKLDEINLAIFELELGIFTIEKFREFQSKVHFLNWPPQVLKFFEENEDLTAVDAGELEDLDFDHFAFYYQNKSRFNEAKDYETYISNHSHFRNRLETIQIEKHFEFHPISSNITKEASLLPQILNGKISDYSDALAISFFQFTKYHLSPEMHQELMEHVTSPKSALFAIKYADKYHINISEAQLLELLKTESNRKGINNCDSFCDELNKVIAKRISKENLEKLPSEKLWIDPDGFLSDYKEKFELKSKNLLNFCQILAQSPKFTADSLSEFIIPMIQNIAEIESPKKILSLLRVINEVLVLCGKNLLNGFISELTRALIAIQNTDISLIYHEMSMIFSTLFNISFSQNLILICDNFDKIVKQTAIFIIPQAVAASVYGRPSQRITKGGLNDQFYIEIPSQRLKVIKAIDKLVSCQPYWQLIIQILPNIIKTYQEYSTKPFFDLILAKLSSVLVSDVNFDSIRKDFTQKILPILFVEPNTPSFKVFAEAASIATQQISPPLPIYYQFIDKLMQSQPIEPNAAHYYRDFVRWLLKYETDPIRKTDIMLEELSNIQKIFATDPSSENSEGLVEALRHPAEGIDSTFMLFGKLALMPISKLQVVVLIHKYYRGANPQEREKCQVMFESLNDSYDQELADALKCVLFEKAIDAMKIE